MSIYGFVIKKRQKRNLKSPTVPPALCTSVMWSFVKAGSESAGTLLFPEPSRLRKRLGALKKAQDVDTNMPTQAWVGAQGLGQAGPGTHLSDFAPLAKHDLVIKVLLPLLHHHDGQALGFTVLLLG